MNADCKVIRGPFDVRKDTGQHLIDMSILPDQRPTTVEQRINFLKAVKDQDLYCEARIIHLGKTLAYAEATVTIEDGALVAKSTATLMRLDRIRVSRSSSDITSTA